MRSLACVVSGIIQILFLYSEAMNSSSRLLLVLTSPENAGSVQAGTGARSSLCPVQQRECNTMMLSCAMNMKYESAC